MKKFRFASPYKSNGRTNFPETKERSGVYLIKENDKLVYIGYSAANLYKTLYRHFETWNHRSQQVVSYRDQMSRKKYMVRVVYCTPKQAYKLEKALIIRYKPRDNENKYQNYELDLQDQKIEKLYESSHVINECPF